MLRSFTKNLFGRVNRKIHRKPYSSNKKVAINFVTEDGDTVSIQANEGEHILKVAHDNDIELEGACEASLACSTCHVIVDPNYYDRLPEPTEEEDDMLDLAFGLTKTSRLGCQVYLSKDLDGITVRIPSATRNMAVDGFKPKPH